MWHVIDKRTHEVEETFLLEHEAHATASCLNRDVAEFDRENIYIVISEDEWEDWR